MLTFVTLTLVSCGGSASTPMHNSGLNPGSTSTPTSTSTSTSTSISSSTSNTTTVAAQGNTIPNLQSSGGWTGYALLPPGYGICSGCSPNGPQTTWSNKQGVSSPSL